MSRHIAMTTLSRSLQEPRSSGETRRWPWIAGFAVALLTLGAAAWFAWDSGAIRAWKESASPLAFFAAMAVLPALGAPLTPFYVIAGATFGLGPGLLGSALALVLNFSLCYFAARRLMRERLLALLRRFDYELPNFAQHQGALRFTVLVKLTPGIPAFLKNYLLGISGVTFGVFLGVSLLAAGLYAVPLMALGQSLFRHELNRSLIIALAVSAALGACAWLWRRQNT
jgi:uncharacterized membrane protein YdjX (TVP38/TMEM64 family)